jgi:hypothetical protein
MVGFSCLVLAPSLYGVAAYLNLAVQGTVTVIWISSAPLSALFIGDIVFGFSLVKPI